MTYEPGSIPVPEIIDLLASTGDDVSRTIAGLSDADLQQTPPGYDGSIYDICCGIRVEAEQVHRHFQHATGEVISEQDAGSGEKIGSEPSTAAEIDAFKLIRAQTVALLAKLDPAAWGHSAMDPQLGNLTIEQAALRLIAHEEEALDRIGAARRALGK